MSNIPANLKYAASHEWLRAEGDGIYTVGITEHAQELLGDMVFVELPAVSSAFVALRSGPLRLTAAGVVGPLTLKKLLRIG